MTQLLIEMYGVPGQDTAFAGKRSDAASGVIDTLQLQAQDAAVTGQASSDDWLYWLTVTPTAGNDLLGPWKFKIGSAAGNMGIRAVDIVPGKTTYRLTDPAGSAVPSGPNAITPTVLDDDTGDPIEAAHVRLFRTGDNQAKPTDDQGEAAFGLAAATYSVLIMAEGYDSLSATLVVAGDATPEYRLTPQAIAVPGDPNLSTLNVKTYGANGQLQEGVTIRIKIECPPDAITNHAYDGDEITADSNASGIASFTVVRGATYLIARGDGDTWKRITIEDAAVTEIPSFIGSP